MHKTVDDTDNMSDQQKSKVFSTKLSLPKFVSTIKRLTEKQRKLVISLGFEHLLHLCCDYIPRGLLIYIVSIFDAKSRTVRFADGSSFTLNPVVINKILGTPVGGNHIGKRVDPDLRISIAQLTNCEGHYPTINELDKLITPDLDGDFFRIVFTMYAMTSFLCPSSHDAFSPDYLHIVTNPNEIRSFDYSSAILEKLVSSIEAYNAGTTCVLGGNLLVLMIIYFEFLDCEIIPSPTKLVLPRLSIWCSALVRDIEMLDCVCKATLQYGRLPIKDLISTPFGYMCKQKHVGVDKHYEELLKFVLSICPEDHHTSVKNQLPLIMSNMYNDIMESIEPIVMQNIMNVLKMIPVSQSQDQINHPSTGKNHLVEFKAPTDACAFQQDNIANEKNVACPAAGKMADNTFSTIVFPVAYETNEDNAKHMLLLPVPSDEVLGMLNEKHCNNSSLLDIENLVISMQSVHIPSEFELPYNSEVLDSLYPQKIDAVGVDDCIPSTVDILSYVLEEAKEDSRLRRLTDDRNSLAYGKVNFMEDIQPRRSFNSIISRISSDPVLNRNKRTSDTSKNYIAENCVALKKRAKMFEINEVLSPDSENVSPTANISLVWPHDQIESAGLTDDNITLRSPDRAGNIDFIWDEELFERELIQSTLKVEAEYLPNRINSDFMCQKDQNLNVSELSPVNVISSFASTLVEKDVFNDIIARVPKTKKAKTINVVRMGSTWAEHRVFALSMMVYGNINPYVMNMLGKSVMVEDAEKENLNLLPKAHWKRYYYDYNVAALFMKSCENPGVLSKYLAHSMIGFKLDSRDLVHLPLFTDGFYFLLVVNFREKLFQVLYPNSNEHLVYGIANNTINNFKMAFKIAYRHSHINVDNMETSFRSVCSSEKAADSGVFIMELIRHQTGGKILCFEPNHAKPLRESLTYYMIAHPFNELMPPETKSILKKHNIPYDYKTTPGYYPWMHEQGEEQIESKF